MNREDIVRMARKVWETGTGVYNGPESVGLERFAALVAAAEREAFAKTQFESLLQAIRIEREACAKVCDEVHREYDGEEVSASWIAAAIRARGENT